MARLAALYPRGPIYVGPQLAELPADHSVPGMDGWRWVHTPGHTAGHVSFFRDADRALIAGDAVVTTKQESALAVLAQRPELHGPPMYFTQDWAASATSARTLAELDPQLVATGHGPPMRGAAAAAALRDLADHFGERAVPRHGRYVEGGPAVADETGVVSVPPAVNDPFPKILLGVGAAAVAGLGAAARLRAAGRGVERLAAGVQRLARRGTSRTGEDERRGGRGTSAAARPPPPVSRPSRRIYGKSR
jgi:hypothetical protein